MSTTLITNFSYNGKNPNFERDSVAKISDLRAVDPTKQKYDYGHIVFCKEDGKHYRFMHNYDAPDEANYNNKTGWFQEFVAEGTGGGGSIDTSNFATKSDLASKQDVIKDLATIRSGAAKGATSVQEIQLNNDPVAQPTNGKVTISESDPIFKASPAAGIKSSDIAAWNNKSDFSGNYNDLSNKPTIPSAVTEDTVSGWGFTKNKGTVTGVKINGNAGPIDTNGVVDLGYIDSGGGDTIINGVTDVTVGGASVVSNNKATIPNASTSAYGVTKLTDAIDKDDSSLAATAKAVSIINANKQDKISDLETIRTDSQNAFKGTINGETTGDLDVVTSVNGVSPNRGAVTIDVGDKNVQSDWNATSGDAFIKNKPTIPTTLDQLTQSASHRTVTDTEKSTWNAKLDKNTADNSYLGKNDKAASATNADNATNDGNGKNISNTYATKAALSGGLAGKQNVITDLETIRAGAAKGATALQSVPKGYATEDYVDLEVTTLWEVVDQKQDILQDNVNIKTINDESILGNGNITIKQSQSDWTETNSSSDSYIKNKPTFKTINGENILGSGDVSLSNYVTKDMMPEYESYGIYFNDGDGGADMGFAVQCGNGLSINDETKALQVNIGNGLAFDENTKALIATGSAAYPLVNHGTSDTTFTLTPNVFHVWSNVASLSLTLGEGTDGVANEYLFQFSCLGGQVTTLGLPSGIQWANGEVPTLEVMKTYQVSILNNCATYVSFG